MLELHYQVLSENVHHQHLNENYDRRISFRMTIYHHDRKQSYSENSHSSVRIISINPWPFDIDL